MNKPGEALRPINIGCAANAKYALPMTVMLTSLVCNLKTQRNVNIFIIESGIDAELKKKVEASVLQNKKSFHVITFHWIMMNPSIVLDLPENGDIPYMTPDTYSRLLIPSVVSAGTDQVIYLDSDVVVLGDMAELSDAADPNATVCAVANVLFPYVSSECRPAKAIVFNYAELGIPATNRYFNAGVLVINVKKWKEQDVTGRALAYLRHHKEEVFLHDQGGLNAILFAQWSRLDQRWNQTNIVLTPECWKEPAYSMREWRKTRNDPLVVHYSGDDKPWNPGFKRPRISFFSRYLKKTLFGEELKISSVEGVIGYRAYFTVWRIKRFLHSLWLRYRR